jgi:hypothetical protein
VIDFADRCAGAKSGPDRRALDLTRAANARLHRRVKTPSGATARAVALSLAALAWPAPAHAEDFVAALWLAPGAGQERLSQRVRGQLSDLPVRLVVVNEPGTEAPLGAQLEAADALARRQGARAVVWFAPLDPQAPRAGLLVVVAEAARGRVLIRRIEAGAAAGDGDSATLEAAALVVRTALRGLSEGAEIGLTRAEVAPAPPPPPPAAKTAAPAAPPQPASRGRLLAAVGWHLTYDGQAAQQGLSGHVGYTFGRWTVGLAAAPSLGAELRDARSTVHLARHAFGAFGEVAAALGEQVSLGAGVSAGAVLFPRSTGATAAGIAPDEASANPTVFAGFSARARWFPAAFRGFVGLWLEGGAELVPWAPTLGYQLGPRFVPAFQLWHVQPGGAAGLAVRTP